MDHQHDHAGHNHSAHAAAGMDMGGSSAGGGGMDMKFMSSVERLPNGNYHYPHGGFDGHVLPGCFFIVWGTWWALTTFAHYVGCLAARRPFRTRAWRPLPCGPACMRRLPLEPLVKIVMPMFGILGELWLGHESYRRLYDPATGRFSDNMNDWQHSTMYASFMASGVVDLLAHFCGAPPGTELAFLGLSFLSEGVLLIFHLKGPRVEILVHLILGLIVFSTVVGILVELAAPSSLLAASVRPWLTITQGVWWIVTAFVMYRSAPQWDPDYHGSGMMVPVPFVLWTLGVAFAMLCTLLLFKFIAERRLGRALSFDADEDALQLLQHPSNPQHRLLQQSTDDDDMVHLGSARGHMGGVDLEMSGTVQKVYAAAGQHGHNGHAA